MIVWPCNYVCFSGTDQMEIFSGQTVIEFSESVDIEALTSADGYI
jgi:hypothetical protein